MANTKDFKVKNGLKAAAIHENVGTLGTSTWNDDYSASRTKYTGKSYDVNPQETATQGVWVSNDGTKMYITGTQGDGVDRYDLSTAWDVRTASHTTFRSMGPTSETAPRSLWFKPDGTELYIIGTGKDSVYQWSLDTAWDISTASMPTGNIGSTPLDVNGQEVTPYGLCFSSDGTKCYVAGVSSDAVHEYTLSTAWDISTATFTTGQSFSLGSGFAVGDISISSDGTKFAASNYSTNKLHIYSLSTAYDITTASDHSVYDFADSSGNTTISQAFFATTDGDRFFVEQGDDIYQYDFGVVNAPLKTLDLSTGSVFEHTPTADPTRYGLRNPPASGTASAATLIIHGEAADGYDIENASYDSITKDVSGQDTGAGNIAWNANGTKMFYVGRSNDKVYEYNVSTAYDVSTAVHNSSNDLTVSTDGATAPFDIAFKPDGTKLFVCDNNTSAIYEYTLSTGFDLSTATYVDNKALSTNGQWPHGFDFKPDGTSVYVFGSNLGRVFQWDMTTAWDISTASYVSGKNLNLSTAYEDIKFNSDGTKLFALLSGGLDIVKEYDVITAYDLSTAVLSGNEFSVFNQANTPYGLRFGNDGAKMYITDDATDTVYQYTSALPIDVSYESDVKWPGGTKPANPPTGTTDVVTLTTQDGGTSYTGVHSIAGAK